MRVVELRAWPSRCDAVPQTPKTIATMEYGAKALGNFATSDVGRTAVNSVKVGLYVVDAPTDAGFYPVAAAKLAVMETAKRNGLSMADRTATDVLFAILKDRFAGARDAHPLAVAARS